MATVPGNFGDVQVHTIPLSFELLPDDDADLADMVRFGFFGDSADEPRITFDGWLDAQAERLRRYEGPVAVWLAGQVDELAALARTLKAQTPAEFDARREVMERDRDEALVARGYDACTADLQGQLCLAWGHE